MNGFNPSERDCFFPVSADARNQEMFLAAKFQSDIYIQIIQIANYVSFSKNITALEYPSCPSPMISISLSMTAFR